MIIYSPVPLEQIFAGIEDEVKPLKEMHVDGLIMQVEQVNESEARIVRLISPNPQDYLNPKYTPGQLIKWQLVHKD